MHRALLILVSVSGVSSLLLIDSAIKGAVLLLFATGVVFFLRRDSAATRYLVWLVAIIAMLAVPLLSAMLPQWRVLPEWASVVELQEENRNRSDVKNGIYEIDDSQASHDSQRFDMTGSEDTDESMLPSFPIQDFPSSLDTDVASFGPEAVAVSVAEPQPALWNWKATTVAVWLVGFCSLILRLIAAQVLLWRTERAAISLRIPAIPAQRADTSLAGGVSHRIAVNERSSGLKGRHTWPRIARAVSALRAFVLRCTPFRGHTAPAEVAPAFQACDEQSSTDQIFTSFAAACTTLSIRQDVTLLLHPDKTIPVVWGVFRPRLMLPVGATDWSDEQLRSVLLHELAHIKRRDILGQLLAQFACALHWFNPLVWFAAWRLHVERERACDDLVLSSGVRASAYAEHLLNVATKLTSSQWTQACGLAMARNSSLHGRLSAVLSEKQNRRRVSTTILAAALLICTAVVVPVAMLCAADETSTDNTDVSVPSSPSSNEPVQLLNSLAGPIERTPQTVSVLRDPGEGETFNPRDGSVRLRHRLSKDIPTRVSELVYLLRNYRVFVRSEEWAEATHELVNIGEPALAPLLNELDQTDRDETLRALGFVLHAMNDPRAVPALIRAIPKTLRPPGSGCGVSIRDPQLYQFMKQHDGSRDPNDDSITINCPVNEILDAMQHLTQHQW
ncbi:MAG: M56 family metallopeptidase, partial [Planctomycetaceae bacterium]